MQYKGFTLDGFQEDAVHAIEENKSVIVSAATGTGKTLIADYIIDKCIAEGKRVIYTAPIKALSNQKYRDFSSYYGKDKIGLLTGDVVINQAAPILIMTTEIYRNMLLNRSEPKHLSYIIYDEIHYMNDPERGTVWEESIIFSSDDVRFLCLSATIPNARIFADWIGSIHSHDVVVVEQMKRAVPLKHNVYDGKHGVMSAKELLQIQQMDKDGAGFRRKKKSAKKSAKQSFPPSHIDLVKYIQEKDLFNTIFFCFSRKKCFEYAQQARSEFDLIDDKKRARVAALFREKIPSNLRSMKSIQELYASLQRGIGVHHAGLLPQAKEVVELLFGEDIIALLYCTETFAVGVNYPAKSVCFDAMRKYDGRTFRYIFSKEYYQIAGRAGRRGIDDFGEVFAMVDASMDNIKKVVQITTSDSEPIISQFRLSVNTVLNLLDVHDEAQIPIVLRNNFDYFMKKKESSKQVRIVATFNNIVKKLKKLDYVTQDGQLTDKGRVASQIYADELLMTELLFSGIFNTLSEDDINVLIGAVVYEEKRADWFKKIKHQKPVEVDWDNPVVDKELSKRILRRVDAMIRHWSSGGKFEELMGFCNLQEGDIIRFFRQIIDRLQQLRKAESQLTGKFTECIHKMDRDVVKVDF